MHLFILDRDPVKAAAAHCDAHVLSQILETAQLLCTAKAMHGEAKYDVLQNAWTIEGAKAYAPLGNDHPAVQWVSEAPGNYTWARRLLEALLEEYQRRWGEEAGKRHKTWDVAGRLIKPPKALLYAHPSPETMTPFPKYMPASYHRPCPVETHREYYRATKRGIAAYKLGNAPQWMLEVA